MERAIFFDKDGTLVENVPYNVDPRRVTFTQGTNKALSILSGLNSEYQYHIVTNQAGVALGYFEEADLFPLRSHLSGMFEDLGAKLTDFHYCPHHPEGKIEKYSIVCHCRKPGVEMLMRASERHKINLSQSWMIGDILDDVESGRRAGCRTILLDNGNETEWILNEWRTPDYKVRDLEEAARVIAGLS